MKQVSKFFVFLLLATSMASALSGCGSGSKPSEAEQQKQIDEQKQAPDMQ